MKSPVLFSISLVILIQTQIASAGLRLECHDSSAVDHGYAVVVTNGHASVSEVTAAGSKSLADDLVCRPTPNHPTYPDELRTILVCNDPTLVDGGYALEIQSGGLAGMMSAVLKQVTFTGPVPLATLPCGSAE